MADITLFCAAIISNVVLLGVIISLLRQNKKLVQLHLIDQERRAMSVLHPDKMEAPSYSDVDHDHDFPIIGRAMRNDD